MLRTSLAAALFLGACASPSIQGGEAVPAGNEPPGRVVGSWRATACRDAKGGAVAHETRVWLIDSGRGGPILVEARPSYDSLVIHSHHVENGDLVFQAKLDDAENPPVLVDVRIPQKGNGDGRMALTRSFVTATDEDADFRARVVSGALACRLSADSAEGQAP